MEPRKRSQDYERRSEDGEESDSQEVNSQLQILSDARMEAERMGISSNHPVILEVEHIISWLELFNGLLTGLVRLNGLLEKSHACQKKLSHLTRRNQNKHVTRSAQNGSCHSKTGVKNLCREYEDGDESSETQDGSDSGNPHHILEINPHVRREESDSLAERVAAILDKTCIDDDRRPSKSHKDQISRSKPIVHRNPNNCKSLRSKVKRGVIQISDSDSNRSPEEELKSKSRDTKSYKDCVAWFYPLASTKRNDQMEETWKTPSGMRDRFNLQKAFETRCPVLMQRSQKRCEYINTKAMIRKISAERRLAETFGVRRSTVTRPVTPDVWGETPKCSCYDGVPPAQKTVVKRVFTHKEMRTQTERIYTKLPEVKEKIQQKKTEDFKRMHRIMRHVFTNRIKEETLRGRLHFPITQNFIVS